jgi:2-succinyl-5-enolpyruvyl-6-hydroxy-3-cyclohexene-1-carboxylate synthase
VEIAVQVHSGERCRCTCKPTETVLAYAQQAVRQAMLYGLQVNSPAAVYRPQTSCASTHLRTHLLKRDTGLQPRCCSASTGKGQFSMPLSGL